MLQGRRNEALSTAVAGRMKMRSSGAGKRRGDGPNRPRWAVRRRRDSSLTAKQEQWSPHESKFTLLTARHTNKSREELLGQGTVSLSGKSADREAGEFLPQRTILPELGFQVPPDSPVVKTLHFHCGRYRFDPRPGN